MHSATLLRVCGLLAILLFLPGCAPVSRGMSRDPAARDVRTLPPARPTRDIILPGEIRTARVRNAFDAVVRLRPEFLARRGVFTPQVPNGRPPTVFVDDLEQRELELLRTVPATVIVEIRYLTASAATSKFGSQHAGGVIARR